MKIEIKNCWKFRYGRKTLVVIEKKVIEIISSIINELRETKRKSDGGQKASRVELSEGDINKEKTFYRRRWLNIIFFSLPISFRFLWGGGMGKGRVG